jgi:hypothetical protein
MATAEEPEVDVAEVDVVDLPNRTVSSKGWRHLRKAVGRLDRRSKMNHLKNGDELFFGGKK